MDELKLGMKIIDGRIVSLDTEKIEKLENISEKLDAKVTNLKERIDKNID